MPLALDKVQEYQRIPGTTEVRLIKTNAYVRITNGGSPPLFVQGGIVYSEGGQIIDPLPEWFATEVLKLSPAIRAEVGLPPLIHDSEEPQPKPKPPKVGKFWVCPECAKRLPARGQTFHELYHKKQAKRAVQVETLPADIERS